jgi:hypothetical protein
MMATLSQSAYNFAHARITALAEPLQPVSWPMYVHLAVQECWRTRGEEASPAADLSPLAAAARQAGLSEREITRTLNSARKTGQVRQSDHQGEAAS